MEERKIEISQVMSQAWELSKKHGLIVALFVLVGSMITSVCSTLFFPWGDYMDALVSNDSQSMVEILDSQNGLNMGKVIGIVLVALYTMGLYRMVLQLTKGELSTPSLSAFKMSVLNYLKVFLAQVLVLAFVSFGSLFCVFPGIYLLVRFFFVPMHLLEHPEDGIVGAFSASYKMTSNNLWNLLGLGFISYGIMIAGYLCCCVGWLFSSAVCYFMMAVAYFTLMPPSQEESDETTDSGDSTESLETIVPSADLSQDHYMK